MNSVVAVLIYEDEIERHFILDVNMNKSFVDDKVFSFAKKNLEKVEKIDWPKYLIRHRIEIEYEENGKTIKSTPFLTIYPFSASNLSVSYTDSLSKKFPVMGCSWDYNTVGKIAERFFIYAKNSKPTKIFKEFSTFFYVQRTGEIFSQPYKINDVFDNEGKKYQIRSVTDDGRYVYLKCLSSSQKIIGNMLNFYIEETKLQRLDDDSMFTLAPNGKKILLDFWGTWCGPCKELTPQLKMLYADYKSYIHFVSIAADDSIEKVKKYISKNDIKWTNTIQSLSDFSKQSILKQFNIGAYPTFILIDETGKIIFREIGIDGFKKLKEFLLKRSPISSSKKNFSSEKSEYSNALPFYNRHPIFLII